jgi:hypothetical protein
MLGLDGFEVLDVAEEPDELVIAVQTTPAVAVCSSCAVCAEVQDRKREALRGLRASGAQRGLCGSGGGAGAVRSCVTRRRGPRRPQNSTRR